ncbi:MAG: hypothetical protein M3508_08745 [Actinomycetota bacterium]|nr:hypothetical protein [Actinomycetota bacterium]
MVGLDRALALTVGVLLALGTLRSAIRTVVLPRFVRPSRSSVESDEE